MPTKLEQLDEEFDELPCLNLPQAHRRRIKQFYNQKLKELAIGMAGEEKKVEKWAGHNRYLAILHNEQRKEALLFAKEEFGIDIK